MLYFSFTITPFVLYIAATKSWNYLWLLPVLLIATWLYSRRKRLAREAPSAYYLTAVISCVPTILAIIGLDIAAVHQVINNHYFAELGLTFAVLGTGVIGSLMVFLLRGLKRRLTPVRQVWSEVLIMANFYILALGLGTAASNENLARTLPFLSASSQIFAYSSVFSGGLLAVWNISLIKDYAAGAKINNRTV